MLQTDRSLADESQSRVGGMLGRVGAFLAREIPSFSASVACLYPVASTLISCEVDPIAGILLEGFHRHNGWRWVDGPW